MIGKMVKIRSKQFFPKQALWVFVGKVIDFTDLWVRIEGRGIALIGGREDVVDIDEETKEFIIPSDNIAHIRILPDKFDIDEIDTGRVGSKFYIKVKDAPDATLGEIGEID